jgi:hypothetical protein
LSTPPQRRNRGWIWFFITLLALTVTAITVLIQYNSRQQLTRQQLDEAMARWQEKGPRNYRLEYETKKVGSTETFRAEVRDGKVISVMMNDKIELEPRQYRYYSIPALFGFIQDFMEQDSKPDSPRTFVTALFDSRDGHPIHYLRSVMAKRERQEITVTKLDPTE